MRIREPTANRYRVLRMKYVRCRRVVDDDCFLEIAANLGQILCEPLATATHFGPQASH